MRTLALSDLFSTGLCYDGRSGAWYTHDQDTQEYAASAPASTSIDAGSVEPPVSTTALGRGSTAQASATVIRQIASTSNTAVLGRGQDRRPGTGSTADSGWNSQVSIFPFHPRCSPWIVSHEDQSGSGYFNVDSLIPAFQVEAHLAQFSAFDNAWSVLYRVRTMIMGMAHTIVRPVG